MASARDKAFIFDTECMEGAVCADRVYNQKKKKKIRLSQRLKLKPRLCTILLYKRETFLNILNSKTKAIFFFPVHI